MVEMFIPYLSWKIQSSGNTSFVMSERAQQFFQASDHTQYQVLALLYEDDLFFLLNMLKVQRSISFFTAKDKLRVGSQFVCLFVCWMRGFSEDAGRFSDHHGAAPLDCGIKKK